MKKTASGRRDRFSAIVSEDSGGLIDIGLTVGGAVITDKNPRLTVVLSLAVAICS